MKISIYELLGLVKDGKAPKKIKANNIILYWDEINKFYENDMQYFNSILFEEIDDKVEIIDEENDEFEDIKEMETFSDVNFYNWFNLDESIRKTNQLIRNQKLLINKIGELNGRNMD